MLHDPSKDRSVHPCDATINRIVDLLERTWVGRHPHTDFDEHCLATACYQVVAYGNYERYDRFRIRQAMDAVAGDRGFTRVEAWNDAPGRTKAEAIEFMEAVRRQVTAWHERIAP